MGAGQTTRRLRPSWGGLPRAGILVFLLGAAPSQAAPLGAAAGDTPAGRLVKEMDLTPAFRTAGDWHLAAFEPDDAGDGDPPNEAAQLCLTGPEGNGTVTRTCTALTATFEGVSVIHNLQRIDSVAVERIPTRVPGRTEPALVVRAHALGGSGTLSKLFVWTYIPVAATPFNHGPGGFFMEAFSDVVADGGEQRLFLSGPLAGCFVSAQQVPLRGQTMQDPQPFSVRVFRRGALGFVPVLSLLTTRAYPTIRGGVPPTDPIERELPRVVRVLAAVYPHGLPR